METDYILLDEAADYSRDDQNYPYSKEAYSIIGACMEVHNILGKGFLEVIYKDALEYEFNLRKIPYTREQKLEVFYKDIILPHYYFSDFFVFDEIILEIKAQQGIIDELYKQTINYLAASRKQLGLLVNFGEDSLKFKRVVLTKSYDT
jgi:GxxExxY protein